MPTNLTDFPWAMFGGDFKVYWNTGVAVLRGFSPYIVPGAFYPPLTSCLFGLLALLPPVTAYVLWSVAEVVMLVHVLKGRRAFAWVFFYPITFLFLSGNMDLLAVWASQFLGRKGWRSIAAVVLICLKPQMAFVLLPFWLWKWAREDRGHLLRAGLVTAGVNLLPLAIRPSIFGEWLAALRIFNTGGNVASQPGIWQLTAGRPDLVVPILAVSVLIVLVALLVIRGEPMVRAVMLLALPAGHDYDSSTLMSQAPAWLLIPISWLGAYLSWRTEATVIGHMLVPITALAWMTVWHLRDWRRTMPDLPDALRTMPDPPGQHEIDAASAAFLRLSQQEAELAKAVAQEIARATGLTDWRLALGDAITKLGG